MLSKTERLPIQTVARLRGFSFGDDVFRVKVFQPATDHTRFGVVVGGRVFKKSVDRNKIKRITYEILGQIKKDLPQKDYLVIVQRGASGLAKEKINKALRGIFKIDKGIQK